MQSGSCHIWFIGSSSMPSCGYGGVLVRVSVAAMKLHEQKQVGEERDYAVFTSTLLFITKQSQDRN